MAENNKTRLFYVLYSDKTRVFDQSERAYYPIYIINIYRRVDICRTAHRVLNSRLERSRCVKQINSISDLSFYY